MKFRTNLLLLAVIIVNVSCSENYRGNPIVTDMFTADPCPMVYNDTLYIFTGHDEQNQYDKFFLMNDWYVFTTTDMYNYTKHGPVLSKDDFSWVESCAFASHCIERNGKFYWYISAKHNDTATYEKEGFAVGVAVADHPLGPYKDAVGAPIIYDTTTNSVVLDIDPAVFIDDDGQAYLFWGSWGLCRMVKLKENMIETEGPIHVVDARNFFEAPFINKIGDTYYLSYAGSGYPSLTEYSTSKSIYGPWEYKDTLNSLLPISETNHQGIVEYKGQWYFVYHNSQAPQGGVFRRSICVDKLEFDDEGNMLEVVRTETSVPQLKD